MGKQKKNIEKHLAKKGNALQRHHLYVIWERQFSQITFLSFCHKITLVEENGQNSLFYFEIFIF